MAQIFQGLEDGLPMPGEEDQDDEKVLSPRKHQSLTRVLGCEDSDVGLRMLPTHLLCRKLMTQTV